MSLLLCQSQHRLLIFLSVDNLPRTLSEFGVGSGSRLRTDDFLQNYQLVLNITHRQATCVSWPFNHVLKLMSPLLVSIVASSEEVLPDEKEFEVLSDEPTEGEGSH